MTHRAAAEQEITHAARNLLGVAAVNKRPPFFVWRGSPLSRHDEVDYDPRDKRRASPGPLIRRVSLPCRKEEAFSALSATGDGDEVEAEEDEGEGDRWRWSEWE